MNAGVNRYAVALHEATHAAVALHQGLAVRRVLMRGWFRVPRYCAQLYPGLVRGVPVKASICLLEEDCLDTHPFEVLVAMAAPSFVATDDAKMNTYAWLEAKLATRYATNRTKIRPERILDRARSLAAVCEPRIYEIAERLDRNGWLDAEMLAERHFDRFQQARADHRRQVQRGSE
jgi:hypothetical protein